MGFFKKIGRQVEQFKQTAKETAEDDTAIRCDACETQLETDYDECPACGATNSAGR